jgi:hypothetical protein
VNGAAKVRETIMRTTTKAVLMTALVLGLSGIANAQKTGGGGGGSAGQGGAGMGTPNGASATGSPSGASGANTTGKMHGKSGI